MPITTLGSDDAVSLQVAGVQAAAAANIDVSEGSVTLALVQGVKGAVLWLQALAWQAVAIARLATSFGADADSWTDQISLTRIGATASTGSVTFSRLTIGTSALVPIGNLVSTGPGGLQFAVTADSTNPAYSAASNGYVIAASAASVSVPVQCTTPGTVGNVAEGTINSFVQPILYVDTVTNPAPFGDALDAETDAALKARVPLYVTGLRSGTPAAIQSAALSVQQGIKVLLRNAYPAAGFYALYVDDGSGGNAPDSLLQAVYAAVEAVTAEGVQPAVLRPTPLSVTIVGSILVATGANASVSGANASIALASYIAGLAISDAGGSVGTLSYLLLPSIIMGADPNITGVTSLSVNNGMADVVPPIGGIITVSSITLE